MTLTGCAGRRPLKRVRPVRHHAQDLALYGLGFVFDHEKALTIRHPVRSHGARAFASGVGRTLVARYRAIVWTGAAAALAVSLLIPTLPVSGRGPFLTVAAVAGNMIVGLCASPHSSRAIRRFRVARCSPSDRLAFCKVDVLVSATLRSQPPVERVATWQVPNT